MLEVYYHRYTIIIAISMKCCEITGFRDISKNARMRLTRPRPRSLFFCTQGCLIK